MADAGSSRLSPLPILAGILIMVGAVGLLRDQAAPVEDFRCPAGAEAPCDEDLAPTRTPGGGSVEAPPVLDSESACRDVGYLCADLAGVDRVHVRRWRDFDGTIVVHVPRPDFENNTDGARLQEAAARGLRAWNGQPFAILTDLRGAREPHFAVRWSRSLSGNQIGVARTQWSSLDGLSVLAIELTTRNPFAPGRVNAPRQVQLTAAHEMGHALGLPHSDSERDVMFPTNTATSLSAQDYRTMESLYALPDGTQIVR